MFEDFSDLLTVKDLQHMLHVGRNVAYELIWSGKIPHLKIKNNIRIRKVDVIFFIQSNITTHYEENKQEVC